MEPRITLKLELRHDVRHQGTDVERIMDRLKSHLNHPDTRIEGARIDLDTEPSAEAELTELHAEVENSVKDLRIAVGHRASGLYLELSDRRWTQDQLNRLAKTAARKLDFSHYADDVELRDWRIEATEPGERV